MLSSFSMMLFFILNVSASVLMKDNSGVQVDCKVVEAYPNAMFKVVMDNGAIALVTISGKIRKFNIRINPGDDVVVELSPYDLTRGRITKRL